MKYKGKAIEILEAYTSSYSEVDAEALARVLEYIEKYTAKKILQTIKNEVEYRNGATLEEDLSIDATIFQEVLDEIAKQYGV